MSIPEKIKISAIAVPALLVCLMALGLVHLALLTLLLLSVFTLFTLLAKGTNNQKENSTSLPSKVIITQPDGFYYPKVFNFKAQLRDKEEITGIILRQCPRLTAVTAAEIASLDMKSIPALVASLAEIAKSHQCRAYYVIDVNSDECGISHYLILEASSYVFRVNDVNIKELILKLIKIISDIGDIVQITGNSETIPYIAVVRGGVA